VYQAFSAGRRGEERAVYCDLLLTTVKKCVCVGGGGGGGGGGVG
jgi:hypothetical protein